MVGLLLIATAIPGHAQLEYEVFADSLDFPTNMAFSSDGRLFFSEKNTGRVRIIRDGALVEEPFATVPVTNEAETGLLGLALHPGFPDEPWVYLYYSAEDRNRIVRIRAEGDRGGETETILEGLPVVGYHNGGDITFGSDGMLYAVLGESHDEDKAQDEDDLGGKILRLEPDGRVPDDNPMGPENPVYSLGHRNSFGICVDPLTGSLWETENGPSSHDELNRIEPGGNYGWPVVSGGGGEPEFIDPQFDFPQIIVPTGCAFYTAPLLDRESQDALFFGDFNGQLHRVRLTEDRLEVTRHEVVLTGLPGITDVQLGPDGRLYVATAESIVRLPGEIPAPDTPPGPMPTRGLPASSTDASPVAWFIGIGAVLLAGIALLLFLRRRRPAD